MLTHTTNREGRLLTADEVAKRLRVHRATVYRLIHSGELPAVKLASRGRGALRVDECELAAWLLSEGDR